MHQLHKNESLFAWLCLLDAHLMIVFVLVVMELPAMAESAELGGYSSLI